MRMFDRIAVGLGTLDIVYVAWTTLSIALGSLGIRSPNFGMPFSRFEVAVNLVVYLAMAVCGVALVLRSHRFAWLNYLLLPIRILLVIPTLYPILALLTALGVSISTWHELLSLILAELLRCVFIFWWNRKWRRRSNASTGTPTAQADALTR